ncbi:MAG: hypothetical protein ACP5L4_06425 [Thermoplasmata archaeon]
MKNNLVVDDDGKTKKDYTCNYHKIGPTSLKISFIYISKLFHSQFFEGIFRGMKNHKGSDLNTKFMEV